MSDLAQKAWADTMATHSGASVKWGPNNVDCLLNDPKRLAFLFSRYKFAAKMMASCSEIIDIGCGDGMGTLMFLSDTRANSIVGIDSEQSLIDHANKEFIPLQNDHRLRFICQDFDSYYDWNHNKFGSIDPGEDFAGLCCLDVIEHIDPTEANEFVLKLCKMLRPDGVAVIGTPSARAAQYGSVHSKIGHINLYEPDAFRDELTRRFRHVFLFSMNDEIVHTGFDKMAHYLIGLCVK